MTRQQRLRISSGENVRLVANVDLLQYERAGKIQPDNFEDSVRRIASIAVGETQLIGQNDYARRI